MSEDKPVFRFHTVLSLDHDELWIIRDSMGIYADSRPMFGADAVCTAQWLNGAHVDGRLRTLDTEYNLGEWIAE